MKYSWDIENIKKKLNKANNSSSKLCIDKKIYSSMLADLTVPKREKINKVEKNEFFTALDKFDINYFNNTIFKLINYIASNLVDNSTTLCKNDFDIKKNDSTVIKICKDFYKKNDKDSLLYFKKIINNESRINFINTSAPFLGRTYIINMSEYYILINGKNYLEDTLSLVHESKHVEMFLKGYNKGITHYEELSSILYELYMIDYLLQTDNTDDIVNRIKIQTINKYVNLINNISSYINYIKRLKESSVFYDNIKENYDLFYYKDELYNIFSILNMGVSEKEIGKIVSFIVAIDIYLNSKMSNVNNVLSCYIFGIYKLKPGIVDCVIKYINSIYEPYINKDSNKNNKKIKYLY